MRIKRGREWIEAGIAADPFRQRPPDGLDDFRASRKRNAWRTERAKLLTRDRVRRHRERAKQSYGGSPTTGVTVTAPL